MDELRRRRSFWFDRSQSGSERAAEAEPQRRSFIRNGSQSFLRRFICGSDGLAWQLQPISPEYVPLPRYRLLSRSATETSLSYEPRTPPESHQGNRRGDLKAVEVVKALEMKTAALGGNFKLQRSQSSLNWLAGRSKSSRLLQDSLSPYDGAFVALPGYERLSKSMRLFSEEPRQAERVRWRPQPQQGGLIKKVIGQVFFIGKVGGDREKEDEGKEKEKKNKKRSSWLPDPERRWPVQGW